MSFSNPSVPAEDLPPGKTVLPVIVSVALSISFFTFPVIVGEFLDIGSVSGVGTLVAVIFAFGTWNG